MNYLNTSLIMSISALILMSCGANTDKKSEGGAAVQDTAAAWNTGVALYSFNKFPFSESLEKAEQAEVRYVEGFSFHQLGGEFNDQPVVKLSDQEIETFKGMLDERGLQMPSMYADAKSGAEWKSFFELGKKLGLKFFVAEPEPALWDTLDSLAGAYNIKIAIHQHAKGLSRFWHPDSVLAAVKGRPNFGACGDLGHWVRSGLDPVACLAQLEGHLISIHAKDLDGSGNEAKDVKVGDGVIDYKAVLHELKRQNFTGPVYIECEHNMENNLDDVKFAVQYLNRLTEE